jgi:hypothetical protein
MPVFKRGKITFYHGISKMIRALHGCDLRSKAPCFKKMPGLPGNRFAFADQSVQRTCNGFFIGRQHGDLVEVDTPAQVKNPFNGRSYECCQVNMGHGQLMDNG